MQRGITSLLHSAKSHIDGCLANGTEQTSSCATVPYVIGGRRPLKPILITNAVGVDTFLLELATQDPPPAAVLPSLSPRRLAAKRLSPSETLLARSLGPVSNLVLHVGLRRRRLQQHGLFDRGRDREQSFLGCSSIRSTTRRTCHKKVETFRWWASRAGIPLETVPEVDQALVWCLNEKFFDGVVGRVASKVLAVVAHE